MSNTSPAPESITNVREVGRQELYELWLEGRKGLGVHPGGGELITKQSDAEGTDLNAIVQRYRSTGTLPVGTVQQPSYGDFTTSEDFLELRLRMDQAEADFLDLPATIRDRYKNDLGRFIDAVYADGEDGDALREELGLQAPPDPLDQVEPSAPVEEPSGAADSGEPQPPAAERPQS